MLSRGLARPFLALLIFTTTFGLSASAQWMFEKKPSAKGSAFEIASSIPEDALFVSGFHLKGQVDVLDLLKEVKQALLKSEDAREEVAKAEQWLTAPVEDWAAMFNGRGFLAMLDPAGQNPSESWIFALQLDKPAALRDWLKSRDLGKPSALQGFEIYDLDGNKLGFGKGWVFLARTQAATEVLTSTLSGSPRTLSQVATFRRAQSSLTGGQSGLFLYLDGEKLRRTLFGSIELPQDHPATESLGFWDFAVLSFDFVKEESDGFLGYTERDGKVATALRRPGRVTAALFDLLPDGLSSASASDLGWAYHAVEAFGDEIPEVGMVLGFAHSALNQYGDFEAAFAGTMVTGSNALDVLAQFLQFDYIMARRQGQLTACKSNLKNIGTSLEIYRINNDGEYPKSLEQLTPETLVEIPVCPTDGAQAYQYAPSAEGEGSYLLTCVGHQHPTLKANFPKYTSEMEILEEYDETASSAPVIEAAMEEPSLAVVLPVESSEAAHDLMLEAVESNKEKPVDACGDNLMSIASAATFYTYDHDGAYPKKVADMVPDYLAEVPKCPLAGKDTYSESYSVVGENQGTRVYCQGHNHPELEVDRPLYDTTSDEGIETGPVAELPAKEKPPAPTAGSKATYEVKSGPKGVLDPSAKTLRLAYGPRASELLASEGGQLSKKPLVMESLQFGQESAVYLDYVDLGPLYGSAVEALQKGADSGSDEAAVTLDILKAMRKRVKGLDSSSCVKVTEKGLHFRSRGIASSQMVGGFLIGTAAVGVPNFARAKAQGQLTACKSNLKNIGTALEMWATDHDGKYPQSLAELTPDYLVEIPQCAAAAADTYSATYELKKHEMFGENYYEFFCKGHHHAKAGIQEDYPRYDAMIGLIEQ